MTAVSVCLDRFDHFVSDVPRAPYLRYVDDFALFADDPARLEAWRARADRFLEGRRLSLHPAKTRVAPPAFLGYALLPGGRRRLLYDGLCGRRKNPPAARHRL